MKIYFVAADFGGSALYRIAQPAGLCRDLYEDSLWSLPLQLNVHFLQECDMLVVQRQCDPKAIESTNRLLKLNKIMVTEIDDNIWSIPPDTGKMAEFWTKENIKGFEQHLRLCHAVTVSTNKLAKLIKPYNPNVFVVPNLVVFEKNYTKIDMGKIRIGWAGSDTHIPDFTPDIQQALLEIKDQYKEKVDIFMFGHVSPDLFTKVTFYPFQPPHLYLDALHKFGLDIGIIPNRDNLFNACRSPLKFVEYSSVKAMTIASKTDSFINEIQNGKNGILVKNNSKKSWKSAIIDMIENETERRKMAENAFEYCYKKYSVQENKDQYKVYGEIMNKVQGG